MSSEVPPFNPLSIPRYPLDTEFLLKRINGPPFVPLPPLKSMDGDSVPVVMPEPRTRTSPVVFVEVIAPVALIVVAATVLGVVLPRLPFRIPPVMVLFVSVSVVALPTKVSVASGSESVLSTVCVLDNIVRVFVVPPLALNMMRFVASVLS